MCNKDFLIAYQVFAKMPLCDIRSSSFVILHLCVVVLGMAFGTGSAVAHRAVDAVMGPRTIQHEAVVAVVNKHFYIKMKLYSLNLLGIVEVVQNF